RGVFRPLVMGEGAADHAIGGDMPAPYSRGLRGRGAGLRGWGGRGRGVVMGEGAACPAIGGDMPAPYSRDLRERVIGFMALGGSARAAAMRFDVSVSSATRWAQRWRAGGHARPRAMGG